MTTSNDITDALLLKLAGEAAFHRGLGYFEDGNVLNWTRKGRSIRAEVEGSETYLVTLNYRSGYLDGYCDCPASEGVDFCKHCVAVAMAVRRETHEQAALASGTEEQRIQGYLRGMNAAQLAEHLLQVILDDTELTQEWALKVDLALGKIDHRALKKRITAALPYNRHLYRYQQVRAYFAKAEPVFDLLAEQAAQLPAETALRLTDYGLQRLAHALDTIDDSGGFRFPVENGLQSLHQQLVSRLDWAPEKLSDYLYSLASGECADFYPRIPDDYIDVLDDNVLECYYQRLQSEWDKLPSLAPNADWDKEFSYLRLQRPLLEQAQASEDFPAQVALLRKTAIEEHDFLSLCSLCMENDAWDQAALWLAKARKLAGKNRGGDGVDRLQVRLHLHKDEMSKALELQWHIYTKSLKLDDFQELLVLNRNSANPLDYPAKARAWLQSRLDEPANQGFFLSHTRALIALYLHENDLEPALRLVAERAVPSDQLLELARRMQNQPNTAMPLYSRLVAANIRLGNNEAYRDGIALLRELAGILKVAAHQQAFSALLIDLRREFKAKRNFIKWLNEAFPEDSVGTAKRR